jgi:hypothetical protein
MFITYSKMGRSGVAALIAVLAVLSLASVVGQGRPLGKTNLKNPPSEPLTPAPDQNPPTSESARLDVLGSNAIEIVRPGVFKVGDVMMDQERQEIRFPVELNMKKGPVEYFLCTGYGKVHETVLRTKTKPYHIHVAMLLLGAGKKEGEADQKVDPRSLGGPIIGSTWADMKGDSVSIEVEWDKDGQSIRRSAKELMKPVDKSKSIGEIDWIYNGSVTAKGIFYAQLFGDLISVIPDDSALINSRYSKEAGLELYEVNAELAPELGTPVHLIIKLRSDDKESK